jgi:hypothetical protein
MIPIRNSAQLLIPICRITKRYRANGTYCDSNTRFPYFLQVFEAIKQELPNVLELLLREYLSRHVYFSHAIVTVLFELLLFFPHDACKHVSKISL